MFVLPIERYHEGCKAFNAFTKDVSQLTQEIYLEQSNIATDFWRQSLSTWGGLIDSFTETSDPLRASMNRTEPLWTPPAWEETRENVAQAMDAAREEALGQTPETAPTAGVTEQPRKRSNEGKNVA